MRLSTLNALLVVPLVAATASYSNSTNSTAPIITTKITPGYWRATFADPPFNLEDNAWFTAFYSLVDSIANDPDVKVVVFDSSALDFFIAHLDILNPISQDNINGVGGNLTKLANLPVLTIAAIRGIAHSGGAEFAAAMDVRFASKKARFGQIEVAYGQLPGGGGMSLLPRLVGRSRALEIILGAEDYDADTAALYGWINRAIPDADFEAYVDSYARRVARFDKFALAQAKSVINKRSTYPAAEEFGEDFATFLTTLADPNVQARVAKAVELGLQSCVDFEVNVAQRILVLAGQGPWNATRSPACAQ